jgi:hypothetical protein
MVQLFPARQDEACEELARGKRARNFNGFGGEAVVAERPGAVRRG